MRFTLVFLLLFLSLTSTAQKKVLDHQDVALWKSIKNDKISPNGEFVVYDLAQENSDSYVILKSKQGETLLKYYSASNGKFTYDSKFLTFTIKPLKETVDDMKRKKVKKNKFPKDTLAIYNLNTKALTKIPNVKSYSLPEKWSGYIAYFLEDLKTNENLKTTDSSKTSAKEKKVSDKNGFHLVTRNLNTKAQDTFKYVTKYTFAKKAERLAFASTGEKDHANEGVFIYNFANSKLIKPFTSVKAKYSQLQFSETGKRFAFVVDTDTTKTQVRPNALYTWEEGKDVAVQLHSNTSTPKGYLVSPHGTLQFSEDDSKLYFGLRTPPILKDTTLLKDEIVNVEVWTYNEPRLYTVQELQVKNDTIKSYQTVYDFNANKTIQIETKEFPDAKTTKKGNANIALVSTKTPYELESQWSGMRLRDFATVNIKTGQQQMAFKAVANANLSPKAKYAYGYKAIDSSWFTYNIETKTYNTITKGKLFYDELNDSPKHPSSYGLAGWTESDKSILLYDRYDIWKYNPDTGTSVNLTNGRDSKTVYRYIKLDNDVDFISTNSNWLLSTFNEDTKEAGFAEFNPKNNKLKQLVKGPYTYKISAKAERANSLLFTRESFEEFPNLRLSNLDFKKQTILSDANPQQKDFNWGTIELIEWTSLDGKQLKGLLAKPENFNPNKKYPMIVNFYERYSDRLHNHRAPSFGRSTINYSFYTSRGYVIFNPDIEYRIGYPGESAYNCVIPGVTNLIDKGFIDKDNIGVQGHSWGGYQIAYLVTKTDIFKAAESGAPVPNMISAYGGIRWWTGLSRQFQYEHTQSRIGGTPWEYPMRYIENSPIFNIDKINTPLLIMNNDADGHVPWYQGIEFFVSLRRLGKPSWFLNYNEEPHWPLKYQNRKDFNIRMAQFFDYYLKGAPKPVWMERGVPAVEKGINQGYELLERN
ncbi:prolyl oligopeptidase family protein [Jejuia pallidilutea]|uniref:Prolyl oligopeptidase family protein n=1 Tax=Jejuia pallidilutea TaxID=504487 RepID=A0A362X5P0_9FLAO|nr:prolyl oligopeptidase family serine peptidase [Jejuia pallidilutea]PQV45955.1 prolyl oligopeptidase family protein [Jejuia pallidilutea]